MEKIVIVGAGQAGGCAARTLRDSGFDGRIRLFGDEAYPPYERPPLSKDILQGSAEPDSSLLWSPQQQAALGIDAHFGSTVVRIDRQKKQVVLRNGAAYPYDRLLLTTGSRVRRLEIPGFELGNVHYLRNIDDAVAIRSLLTPGARLLVIGAGWIGMEVAASARKLGADVVVADIGSQPCSRVLPEEIGRYLMRLHAGNGVRMMMNTSVERLDGKTTAETAYLSTGEVLPITAIVIGIGVVPNVELATNAGLETGNGILVDEFGRTSDDSIFAAGDVANQPTQNGGTIRHESWSNAQNHAIAVAKAMLDQRVPFHDIPYFWSDQYDVSMQVIGSLLEYDETVARGEPDGRQFVQFYLRKNRIAGAVGVNNAQDISVAKKLMQQELSVTGQQLVLAPKIRELLMPPKISTIVR